MFGFELGGISIFIRREEHHVDDGLQRPLDFRSRIWIGRRSPALTKIKMSLKLCETMARKTFN